MGITLVRGMEISTRPGHASVHLLAYLPDPTYPPLARALADILDGRNDRVPAICAKLRRSGSRSPRTTYAAGPATPPPRADRTWPTR